MTEKRSKAGRSLRAADLRRELDSAFYAVEAGNGLQAVADMATLIAADDTLIDTGSLRYVATLGAYFQFDGTSVLVVDGITVLPSFSSHGGTTPGRWLRLSLTHPKWSYRTAWYLDPVGGGDERDGATSGTALKTHAELVRRLGTPFQLPHNVTVTWLSGHTGTSDAIRLEIDATYPGYLTYVGTPTQTHSGTLTAVTERDETARTAWVLTDSGANFTSTANQLLRNVSQGYAAWVSSPTSTTVKISEPLIASDPVSLASQSPDIVTPAIGDTYTTATLPIIYVHRILSLGGHTNLGAPLISFYNIDFRAATEDVSAVVKSSRTTIYFFQCAMDHLEFYGNNFRLLNCNVGFTYCNAESISSNIGLEEVGPSTGNGTGGGIETEIAISGGYLSDQLTFDQGSLVDGVTIGGNGALIYNSTNNMIGSLAILNGAGTIYLNRGASLVFRGGSDLGSLTGKVWCSSGANIRLSNSTRVYFLGSMTSTMNYPSSTITAGLFQVKNLTGTLNSQTTVPRGALNASPIALTTGVVSPQLAVTPTNFDATSSATSFGGHAVNFQYDIQILKL